MRYSAWMARVRVGVRVGARVRVRVGVGVGVRVRVRYSAWMAASERQTANAPTVQPIVELTWLAVGLGLGLGLGYKF